MEITDLHLDFFFTVFYYYACVHLRVHTLYLCSISTCEKALHLLNTLKDVINELLGDCIFKKYYKEQILNYTGFKSRWISETLF